MWYPVGIGVGRRGGGGAEFCTCWYLSCRPWSLWEGGAVDGDEARPQEGGGGGGK